MRRRTDALPPPARTRRSPCSPSAGAAVAPARRRPPPPTASRAGRSTRTAPTTATCSAATGCFASTTPAPGLRQRFMRQTGARRLDGDDGPQRLERRRQLGRVDDRHRRLVSQGLPPARRARAAWTGSCASSRSTTARGCGSTARRSAATPAPTCRSSCACRAARCKRTGTNRLVIRVDNRRLRTDFPPSGLTGSGDPAGGWWNYGGLLREVYLQRVDRVDVTSVVVRPELPCCDLRGDASLARVVVRNYGDRTARVRVTGSFGGARAAPRHARRVARRRFASFETRVRVAQRRGCGRRRSPNLYPARFARARRRPARRRLHAQQRDPLDQGRRRAAACSTAGR